MKVKQHQPSLLVFKMHQQHAILKIILQRLQPLTMLLGSAYLTIMLLIITRTTVKLKALLEMSFRAEQ